MAEVTGVVQSKRKDGKGVKINEAWYSARNGSFFASVNRGDTVTLQYNVRGDWNNCDENIAPVVTAAAPAGGGGGYRGGSGGGAKAGGRASGFREPDEIVRGEALSHAINFLKETDPDFGDSEPKAVIERTLRTAEVFTAYMKGLIDLKKTAPHEAPPVQNPPPAPAPEPAPAPAPAPAPVEEPVVGSALSEFLS